MASSTNRDSDKFMLRFPEGMRDRIREVAESNGRSMNSEIIARLEASFTHEAELQNVVQLSQQHQRMQSDVMTALTEALTKLSGEDISISQIIVDGIRERQKNKK